MMGDMPHIGSTNYGASTSTFALAGIAQGGGFVPTTTANAALGLGGVRRVVAAEGAQLQNIINQESTIMATATTPTRRLVQVFIADPDENVPLEKSLLYTGTQKLTDATDQELYFEIDIKTILETHNAARIQMINKKVKERVEYLEPARVRDLRMVVVNVAQF